MKPNRSLLGLAGLLLVLGLLLAEPVSAFDGERALQLIRDQVALGPRIPGTPAHDAGRQWIVDRFEALDYHVVEQRFGVTLPLSGAQVEAVNIWALPRETGPTSPALIISAHWDTRPWADESATPGNPRPLFDGANDGGSGVAMAIELARTWREHPLRPHIAFAMWDVEDAGVSGQGDSYALGSQYAVENPPAWIDRLALGINLDMVAGLDMDLKRERYSMESAPEAVAKVWELGAMLQPDYFNQSQTIRIIDDHLPWVLAGYRYINLIGWPYVHWHTVDDTVENCRAEVMQAIGEVVQFYVEGREWMSYGPTNNTHEAWKLSE